MSPNIESLSNSARTILLSRIANALTICARDRYEVGTERVWEPEILRAYNELLHRVTGAVRDHLLGREGCSLENIIEMMRAFGQRNNRANEIRWALKQASEKPLP